MKAKYWGRFSVIGIGISNPEVSADTTTSTLTQDNLELATDVKSNTGSVSNGTSVNSNNNDSPISTGNNNQAPSTKY